MSQERRPHRLSVLFSGRYLALVFGVSVPVNIGMSVFIWYITPVMLEAQGVGLADIGRVVMLYYLAQVLAGPTVARIADGPVGQAPFLVIGIMLSGTAISALYFWNGLLPVIAAVTVFGLGHSMCDATQYARALRMGEETGIPGEGNRALSALRLIERLAAIVGLIVSVVLVARFGFAVALAAIGGLMLAGAALMLLAGVRWSAEPRKELQ